MAAGEPTAIGQNPRDGRERRSGNRGHVVGRGSGLIIRRRGLVIRLIIGLPVGQFSGARARFQSSSVRGVGLGSP